MREKVTRVEYFIQENIECLNNACTDNLLVRSLLQLEGVARITLSQSKIYSDLKKFFPSNFKHVRIQHSNVSCQKHHKCVIDHDF